MLSYNKVCIALLIQLVLIYSASSQNDFPIRQFFDDEIKNDTNNLIIFTINNADEYLCNKNFLCCSCSANCMKYRDCCIDRLWNTSNPTSLNAYVEVFIAQAKQYKETSCENILPNLFESESIYMVTTCNEHASTQDINECLNASVQTNAHIIPVLGDDGHVYRNSFCARCNYIRTFQVLNLTAQCESKSSFEQTYGRDMKVRDSLVRHMNSTINTTTTTTTMPQSSNSLKQFRRCSFQIVRNNITRDHIVDCFNVASRDGCRKGNPYYDLCHAYTGNFQGERNYHCLLCKSKNPEEEKLQPRLYQCSNVFFPDQPPGSWSHVLSLNFGRSVGISESGSSYSSSQSVCQNGFYNIVTEKCETFSCEKGYKRVGSQCIQNVYVNNPSFENCLLQTGGGFMYFVAMPTRNITTYQNVIISMVNASFHTKIELFSTNESHIIFEVAVNTSHNVAQDFLEKISRSFHVTWTYFDQVFLASNSVLKSELYQFDIKRSFKGSRFCSNPISLKYVNNTISNECHYTHDNVTHDYVNSTYWIALSRYENTRFVSVCNVFHLHAKCPLDVLISNYTIVNTSLVVQENQKIYPPTKYAPLEHGIGICKVIEDSLADWLKLSGDIEHYFSVIITSVSAVCLAVVCMSYCYFKELRNLPGLNVIGFTLTLLITDITFIISIATDVNATNCKSMAVFLHWGLIISYFWMIIIAFDLSTTFTSQTREMGGSPKKTFIRYVIFVISVPTVFVFISVVLDKSNTYIVGYGEYNFCFITRFYPRLYFYTIPVFLVSLATLICFSIAILSIYKTDQISRKTLQKKQSVNLLKIGIKLAVILGFIEFIGFLQISKSELNDSERLFNSIAALLYTAVRSSKGIFLFLIYMANEHKLKLFKKELKKLRHAAETSRSYEMTVSTTA